MSTLRELFTTGISLFRKFPLPPLEAQLLILHCTGLSKEQFFSSPGRTLSRTEERCFVRMAARRLAGCPLAHLTGVREFWSMDFHIRPGVLIPRPETELIVEKTLALAPIKKVTIVDIGTGCGNIALALARELPRARVFATDISSRALQVARANAEHFGLKRVNFLHGDLFSPLRNLHLENRCDFILSNPPYISAKDWDRLPLAIRKYEPRRALLAGSSGLEAISRIIPDSHRFLKPGGYLILEIGKGQFRRALPLFDIGWCDVSYVSDLRGIPRVLVARKK